MVCKEMALIKRQSDEKLLGQVITCKTAKQILLEYGNLYQLIMHLSPERLLTLPGINDKIVQKLLCLKQLLERIDENRKQTLTAIRQPQDVYLYAQEMQDLQQEEFCLLLLNTKNRIIGEKRIFRGSVNASLVSPREIFYAAIQTMASQVIVIHNHPSGEPTPSEEDRAVTKKLQEAGMLLNIPVVDHVIIGRHGYYSFKEADCI
ncbi:hypothetical protein SDC9_20887 [bioreactor metagenome]|uniref:MPN domain-containing protein n=1 Tax=bioreactor metagenome TaxID=1076179 RepID=A0A644U7Y2_9ZZZZ|nr:DNA repair protein RadC [Negativicutes bacterium]